MDPEILKKLEQLKHLEGFGDIIETVTRLSGIKSCSKCKKRKKYLNKKFPLKIDEKRVDDGRENLH